MNILLANPQARISNVPLGLCYLSSSLKAAGYIDVRDIDLALAHNRGNVAEDAMRWCDVLGIHCVTTSLTSAKQLASQAKRLKPGVKIVVGGPHATLMPDEILASPDVDAVVVGEGETAMVELVRAWESGGSLGSIAGLHWRDSGKTVVNPPRPFQHELDSLPFPDREVFRQRDYGFAAFPIIATRSCAFGCTNCMPALNKIAGPYRARSVSNVIAELRELHDKYHTHDISFWDNDISLNRGWLKDLCEGILSSGLKFNWDMQVRVSSVGADRETIQMIRKAGCMRITVGIESGSQNVIDNILKKKMNLEAAKQTLQLFEEEGIQQKCYFMIGIPGESKAEMRQTVDFARDLTVDVVGFNVSIPLPGTGYYEVCRKNNWLLGKSWDDYAVQDLKLGGVFGQVCTDQWGPEYVQEIKAYMQREFTRSGWILEESLFATNVLKHIKRLFKRTLGFTPPFPRTLLYGLLRFPYHLFLRALRGKHTRAITVGFMEWMKGARRAPATSK